MNYGQFKENKHECYKMVDGCRLVGTNYPTTRKLHSLTAGFAILTNADYN